MVSHKKTIITIITHDDDGDGDWSPPQRPQGERPGEKNGRQNNELTYLTFIYQGYNTRRRWRKKNIIKFSRLRNHLFEAREKERMQAPELGATIGAQPGR